MLSFSISTRGDGNQSRNKNDVIFQPAIGVGLVYVTLGLFLSNPSMAWIQQITGRLSFDGPRPNNLHFFPAEKDGSVAYPNDL